MLRTYATIRYDQLTLPAGLPSRQLLCVDFVSSAQGFVGGEQGVVLATTDGGQTWTRRTAPSATAGAVRKLWFSTATAGWAATDNGLYRTADGGQTWTRSTGATATAAFTDLQFVNPQLGFATASRQVFRTTNGGTTWTDISGWNWYSTMYGAAAIKAVAFSSADTGMVIGAPGGNPVHYTTTNGGLTWTFSMATPVSTGWDVILRRNGAKFFAGLPHSGGSNAGFYEYPAGASIYDDKPALPYRHTPVYALAQWQNQVVAVGEDAVIKNIPGVLEENMRTDWTFPVGVDAQPIKGIYRAVDFADARTFYAVGDQGLITRFHNY